MSVVATLLVVLIGEDVPGFEKRIICLPPSGRSTLTRNRSSREFGAIDESAKIGPCQSFDLALAIHTEVFPVKTFTHATMAVAAVAVLFNAGWSPAQSLGDLVPSHQIDANGELAFPDLASEHEYSFDAPGLVEPDVAFRGRPPCAHQPANLSRCDVCVPCWTARAAAVMMRRSDPSHRILFQDALYEDPSDPDRYFDRASFEFDYELGMDVSLTRRVGIRYDVEARYLRVDGWKAEVTGSIASAAGLVVESDPQLFLVHERDINAYYSSQFESMEVNLRRHFNHRLILLIGARYVDIDDRFRARLTAPPPDTEVGIYDTTTDNRLFGLQLGGEAALWDCGRLRIDNIVKAGVYLNDCGAQDTVLDDSATGVFPASDAEGQVSFLGEVGLYGVYRLTDNLSIRAGYQVMWIQGVALATDQMAVTDFVAEDGIDVGGGLFYHGGMAGVEFVR